MALARQGPASEAAYSLPSIQGFAIAMIPQGDCDLDVHFRIEKKQTFESILHQSSDFLRPFFAVREN
jgi:hypothetical protein